MMRKIKLLLYAVVLLPALTHCMETDRANIVLVMAPKDVKQELVATEFESGLYRGVRIGATIGLGAALFFTCKNAIQIYLMNPEQRERIMRFLRFRTNQNGTVTFLAFHGMGAADLAVSGTIAGAAIGGSCDIVAYALRKIKAYRVSYNKQDCLVIEARQ